MQDGRSRPGELRGLRAERIGAHPGMLLSSPKRCLRAGRRDVSCRRVCVPASADVHDGNSRPPGDQPLLAKSGRSEVTISNRGGPISNGPRTVRLLSIAARDHHRIHARRGCHACVAPIRPGSPAALVLFSVTGSTATRASIAADPSCHGWFACEDFGEDRAADVSDPMAILIRHPQSRTYMARSVAAFWILLVVEHHITPAARARCRRFLTSLRPHLIELPPLSHISHSTGPRVLL